jgi:hypothetical protein
LRNIGQPHKDFSTLIFLTKVESILHLDGIANRSRTCLSVVTLSSFIFIIASGVAYFASPSLRLWQLFGAIPSFL